MKTECQGKQTRDAEAQSGQTQKTVKGSKSSLCTSLEKEETQAKIQIPKTRGEKLRKCENVV